VIAEVFDVFPHYHTPITAIDIVSPIMRKITTDSQKKMEMLKYQINLTKPAQLYYSVSIM